MATKPNFKMTWYSYMPASKKGWMITMVLVVIVLLITVVTMTQMRP